MMVSWMTSLFFETARWMIREPSKARSLRIIGYVSRWRASLDPGRNALADHMPWISFAAVDFLENVLNGNMVVFEYGAGGSTLFFAKRVKRVVSVEHDPGWYREVVREIEKQHIGNCEVQLLEPTPDS